MKNYLMLLLILLGQLSWAQVGIGTNSPQESLEVNGSIRMTDGNQADGNILVSDANGSASWDNVTDNIKFRVLRKINQGTTSEFVLWSHPKGIEVRFDTATETVTVENKTANSTDIWNVVIYGGATNYNTISGVNYKNRNLEDGTPNDAITFDLGDETGGWFHVVASNQNQKQDGFIIEIVYYSDDFNGTVQFWVDN